MSSIKVNRVTGTLALLIGLAATWTAWAAPTPSALRVTSSAAAAAAAESQLPAQASGEVVVRLAPGASAPAIAAQVGARVRQKLRFAPNTYVLDGFSASIDAVIAVLQRTPGVLVAQPNHYLHPSALPSVLPNDQFYRQQWALPAMHAPDAWGITVGERFVNGPRRTAVVALIDFGPEMFHQDLFDNMLPGFDFILGQPYDFSSFSTISSNVGHGTNVAGCIAASTNNSFEGIASLPWENVKILPCAVGEQLTVNNVLVPTFRASAVVDAIYYSIQEQADVINMSFGYRTTDSLISQALQDAYDQGIIAVAAVGNNRLLNPSPDFPANLDYGGGPVLAVGAIGASGAVASTSNYLPSIVAPGGDDPTGQNTSQAVLVTESAAVSTSIGGYSYQQGTSLAAGYVSGAIATLITQGALEVVDQNIAGGSAFASDRVDFMRSILVNSARSPVGQYDLYYGYGVLDLSAAMRRVTHYIDISSPAPNEITESFGEPVRANIIEPPIDPSTPGSPRPAIAAGDFEVFQNGVDVTNTSGVRIVNAATGAIEYDPAVNSQYSIGNNTLNITAQSKTLLNAQRSMEGPAEGNIPERAFRFRVTPRILYPGLVPFSVPYTLAHDSSNPDNSPDSLSFLTGGNLLRIARWLPDQSRYAIFDITGSPQEPEAALTTDDSGVAQPPVGNGFWARVANTTQVQLLGSSIRQGFYNIPLQHGWNLIGDPYSFRVPWNTVNVRLGQEVMSIAEASTRNLMRNVIWRFQNGQYTFQALPHGELIPWESNWVYNNAPSSADPANRLTLIVSRVPSVLSQARPAASRYMAQAAPGWKAAIRASVGPATRGEVFLGASPNGQDGRGPEDVEAPPGGPVRSLLQLRNAAVVADASPLLQDVRSLGKKTQRWELDVETKTPGIPVKLSWDRFPSGSHAVLRVEGQSKLLPLDRSGTVELPASNRLVRHLTVTTVPDSGA